LNKLHWAITGQTAAEIISLRADSKKENMCLTNWRGEIHRHLFQGINVWAGKKRIIEIRKDGKQFFPTSHFDNAFRYIDQLIADFRKVPKDNKKLLSEKLAEIIDNVNY
jgi:hypothetical protein